MRRASQRALTFPSGAGSKICIQPEKGPRTGRRCIGPRHPGARNGKRFVQGKAGPIVFRVGMFGYVRLPYVRYFCWSLARPQMLPDRGLPIFVGRLLSTPGPRFCVAKSGARLRVGFPLYMTPPCAFRYPFIEVRTYGLVRRGVPAFGGYRATHVRCMLATFQVEGSAPLRGADLSSCK